MATFSEAILDWPIGPYEDHNFDSVSMQQASVVDSDCATNQNWMHKLKRVLASDANRPDEKAVNVQIQVVTNTTVSASETRAEAVLSEMVAKDKSSEIFRKYFCNSEVFLS